MKESVEIKALCNNRQCDNSLHCLRFCDVGENLYTPVKYGEKLICQHFINDFKFKKDS